MIIDSSPVSAAESKPNALALVDTLRVPAEYGGPALTPRVRAHVPQAHTEGLGPEVRALPPAEDHDCEVQALLEVPPPSLRANEADVVLPVQGGGEVVEAARLKYTLRIYAWFAQGKPRERDISYMIHVECANGALWKYLRTCAA